MAAVKQDILLAKRTQVAPKAIPPMRRMVAALEALMNSDPDAKARVAPTRLQFLTLLSLMGDAQATQTLEKEAAAQKLPVEFTKIDMADRGTVRACARSGWVRASRDPAASPPVRPARAGAPMRRPGARRVAPPDVPESPAGRCADRPRRPPSRLRRTAGTSSWTRSGVPAPVPARSVSALALRSRAQQQRRASWRGSRWRGLRFDMDLHHRALHRSVDQQVQRVERPLDA